MIRTQRRFPSLDDPLLDELSERFLQREGPVPAVILVSWCMRRACRGWHARRLTTVLRRRHRTLSARNQRLNEDAARAERQFLRR